jgi:hypothetical protein
VSEVCFVVFSAGDNLMATTDSKPFQKAIRRTLTHHAGNAPDARAVGEATLITWHLMSARLAPVIGAKGVDILFSRSLHLTSSTFRWLAIGENNGNSADLQAILLARLACRETDSAAEASYALLVTFTELLATMIGETLTERLLLSAWVPPSPELEQETTS